MLLTANDGRALPPLPAGITWPAGVLFVAIGVLPLVWMVVVSFRAEGVFSFSHYAQIFGEPRIITLLGRSLGLAGGATFLALVIGVILAVLLDRTVFPGNRICRVLYLVPLFIPPHIHGLAWISLLGEQGWMRTLPLFQSLPGLYSLWGAIGVLGLSYFPLVTLFALTSLHGMDRQLEEAAFLARPRWAIFWHITLPLLRPALYGSVVFVGLLSFYNYGIPSMLRVSTFPVEIFTHFSALYDEAGASALSMPPALCALVLLLWQQGMIYRAEQVTIHHAARQPEIPVSPWLNILGGGVAWLLIGLSTLMPVAVLVFQAGYWPSYMAAWNTSHKEIISTVLTAILAATLVVAVAYPMARSICAATGWRRNLLDMISYLPFAFPATLLGIGLIHTWNQPQTEWLYTSTMILVIAWSAHFLAFAVRILVAGMRQIEPHVLEAACLCEPAWWRRLWRIELPLLGRAILTAWCVVCVFSLGELSTTLLVIPPGKGTISLKIYTLMHYGAGPLVAALSIILIGCSLLMASPLILVKRVRL